MIDPAAHLGLVRMVAARLARTLPGRVAPEELWGDGYLGLAAAAGCYAPERGTAFSTYATRRIEGAIRDGERARRGWRRRTPGRRRIADALSVERLQELAEMGARAPRLPPAPAGTDDALLREERVTVLRRALLALPEVERTVLAMRYYEDLPVLAIARIFGVTPARISQLHTHALGRLRARVGCVR